MTEDAIPRGESCDIHLVNFNISVEHVFNVDEEGKLPAEATKSWQYYHIEYNLLPNKAASKADVVMSGLVAKMYSEFDTRLLKTRHDGERQFVMWSHKHPVSVTKKLLLDLFSHTVNVRFWDTKDKVSVRAKFDRPKVFRLPPPPGPKPLDARFDGGGTAQSNARRQLHIEKSTSPEKQKPSSSDMSRDTRSTTELSGQTPTELRRKRMERDMVSEQGKCVLSVPLATLFAGNTVLLVHSAPFAHFTALKQVIVKISLNKSLMSDSLSKELCPMKLNIVKSKNNPKTPVSHEDLSLQCYPVFSRYQFPGQERVDTAGMSHSKDVIWNHQHVILLGILSRTKLEEFLTGPPFEVELHDRDRRSDVIKPLPKIFDIHGDEGALFDTSGKARTGAPGVTWNPYGVAKFDLSPLLLGEDKLRLKSPVLPCARPINSSRTNALQTEPNLDYSSCLPSGRYIESGTVMTIDLVLAHPLVQHTNYLKLSPPMPNTQENDCPFSRIVYSMGVDKSELLGSVMDQVLGHNASIFKLDNLPEDMYSSALSTYKLSKSQIVSSTLDYVTGFRVCDGEDILLVLEGVVGGAISEIWESNPKSHPGFMVLYNSELKFSSRLYSSLTPDIHEIRLFEPLSALVQHPALYVRGAVSRDAYEGIICLEELRAANLLQNCSRNNSFPTTEMVRLVTMEFGMSHSILDTKKRTAQSQHLTTIDSDMRVTTKQEPKNSGRSWTPIDNTNSWYDSRDPPVYVDHLYSNKEKVRHVSEANAKAAPKTVRVSCDAPVGHNYSSSTVNSTELAKRKVRGMLAAQPDKRFTYSQDYTCQTVAPRSVQEEQAKETAEQRAQWRTDTGFVFPAHRTALQSNLVSSLPHYSRIEQLREPWEENILHSGKLKPTVDWKTFSWNERGKDFACPRKLPDQAHSCTIHLAGARRAEELAQYSSEEHRVWKSKLVVDNERFQVHRTAPAVELCERGPGAATLQDKAGGILKDPPAKLSLAAPALRLDPIPSVGVVSSPRKEEDECKVFQPGPYQNTSWNCPHNTIPVPRDTAGRFALHFTPHSHLAKLAIKPLNSQEKVGHLWETPAN